MTSLYLKLSATIFIGAACLAFAADGGAKCGGLSAVKCRLFPTVLNTRSCLRERIADLPSIDEAAAVGTELRQTEGSPRKPEGILVWPADFEDFPISGRFS